MYNIAPVDGHGMARQVHWSLLKAGVGVKSPGIDTDASLLTPSDQPQAPEELSAEDDCFLMRPMTSGVPLVPAPEIAPSSLQLPHSDPVPVDMGTESSASVANEPSAVMPLTAHSNTSVITV